MTQLGPEQWKQVNPYLDQALSLPDAERPAWLASLREKDPAIAGLLESLLDEQRTLDRQEFLKHGLMQPISSSGDDLLGTRVGRIRITDILGQGGMGFVYVGFDDRLQRKVALKAVQRGLLTEECKARFLREARVLSQLKHPNICQIHDYLEAPDRDFLVLELIDGTNLKDVIDSKPAPALKMRIARQLAQVLVATHAKGIIHRDLKPANVMLSREDEVKVLDFGLARGEGAASETTVSLSAEMTMSNPPRSDYGVTRLGVVVGTLSYMSPEQARGETVTTASDMYSYGLVLQELFTEKSAYLPGLSPAEQLEKAKTGETVPVTGLDEDLSALINRLKAPAAAVRPTAIDTVEWLERIEAAPQRRRRRAAVWAAGVLLTIVAVGMSYQAWRINGQAKRIAEEATRANREADSAKEVSEFLVKLFEVSDPGENRGDKVTARELLDKAARDIDGRFKEQPLVKARLELTLASVYNALGLFDPALSFAEKSLELRRKNLPSTDASVAEAMQTMGDIRLNRGEFDLAAPLLQSAAEIQEKTLGPDNSPLGDTLDDLAQVYQYQRKPSEAEPLYTRSLKIHEKVLSADDPNLAVSVGNLARFYWSQKDYERAEPLFLRAISIQEKQGPDYIDLPASLTMLGQVYKEQGRYAQAEPPALRAVAIYEKVLGPHHPWLAVALLNLASLYDIEGNYAQAVPIYLRAQTIQEEAPGSNPSTLLKILNNLGLIYREQGKYSQGEPLLLRAIAIGQKAYGPDHPVVATSQYNLALIYFDQRRYAQAEPLVLRVVAIDEKALGNESPETAADQVFLAEVYQREGKSSQSRAILEHVLDIFDKTAPKQRGQQVAYAKALALVGRTDEARVKVRELLPGGKRTKNLLQLCEKLGIKPGN